ncbi:MULTISPECIES: flagellar protein FlaG [Oceanobacillus]|uniref:Flagellar biosynthesis protein FlaG n=1 Tax=Oceanobacillus indicireducens TaxID=1004261 RepID=A0A917XVN7_9BACI|nr:MULTISPECIES: flagellar protein FlaG [Oceanobacillus]GGN53659.1 hypothetical protein GCM10007971_10390 [Oceanobacillus indicireducens]
MAIEKIGSQPIIQSNIQLKQEKSVDRPIIATKENQQKENSNVKIEKYGKMQRDAVEEAVDNLNQFLEPSRRNLKFELHDKLDKYYVTVVDSTTDEVIKEIPPKKILDMYAAMAEFMGLLVDEKI